MNTKRRLSLYCFRAIIKNSVNANSDDAVVFSGAGATSGINKLAWALKINTPKVATDTVNMLLSISKV